VTVVEGVGDPPAARHRGVPRSARSFAAGLTGGRLASTGSALAAREYQLVSDALTRRMKNGARLLDAHERPAPRNDPSLTAFVRVSPVTVPVNRPLAEVEPERAPAG
jgi:hypothetical protein